LRKTRLVPAPETRFDELKRYVRFTPEDAAVLATFRRTAAPHFVRIVQEFYERIREHEEAHAVFKDEAQIQRLQQSLVRWLDRLLGGVYDEAYFEQTATIGRVHVNVGLPQRYMFTAMALIRLELTRLVEGLPADQATSVREAVLRLLDLELAIMLESYRDHFVARIERQQELEKEDLNRALARSERRYVDAVERAKVMIVGLDKSAVVRLFNAEAERVTGYGREEVMGVSFLDLLLPSELADTDGKRILDAVAGREGATLSLDSAIRTRAGKERDVRWSLAHVSGEGDDISLFAVGQDSTDERAALERANQHERLAAVGTLAAGLAHEIRNPLNGARLHVEYLVRALRKSGAPEEMFEAVGVVDDEIRRLADLVSEFLDFARPKPLVLKSVGVDELLARTKQLLQSQAEAGRVAIVCDVPHQELPVVGDGSKLEQVLLNLTQNSIEALSGVGGGTVTLRARRQPRHVRIEIEDDGPGLTSPDAPIFDAFFSTKPNGTGLGLPIVHRIVTDHRGTIDVQSRPGRTTFRVTLPIDGEETRASAPPETGSKGTP
jgi:PAS domain S-box-containing protein